MPVVQECIHRPWRRGAAAFKETRMGKYLIGWLLGVPVIVLVILYFFFH
jgi:hypothetical protein